MPADRSPRAIDFLRARAPEFMEQFEEAWKPPTFSPLNLHGIRDDVTRCDLCRAVVLEFDQPAHVEWHLALSAGMGRIEGTIAALVGHVLTDEDGEEG